MKDKFKCKICNTRFNDLQNVPRLLPCNASMCEKCVAQNINATSNEQTFSLKCEFCAKTHEITFASNDKSRPNLPLDEASLALMRRKYSSSSTEKRKEEESQFVTTIPLASQTSNHRRMSVMLENVNANTNELNSSVKTSKEKLLENFSIIETEVNARADKLIKEVNECRERLIGELTASKQSAVSRLEEALDTQASIQTFQREYSKMCAKLSEKKSNKTDDGNGDFDLDKRELRNLAQLAEDLNEKIVRTNVVIKKMTEKSSFTLMKPSQAVSMANLLGTSSFYKNRLEFFAFIYYI